MGKAWTDILIASFRVVMQHLAQVTPRVLAMLTLLLLGAAVAAIARRLASRALRAADFDLRCGRWGFTASLVRTGIRWSPSELLGRVIFWTILLIGVLMGIEALEIPATAGLVPAVVGFLPNLIVAALIMAAGWILAGFAAESILLALVNAQVAGAPLIASAVRWVVLVFAGGAVLTQLGIAREMVLLAFGIAFGGTVLSLALAFGLGAKDLAREILESRLRKPDPDRDRESPR
jgi:mechanosensitive ion channel-like protein